MVYVHTHMRHRYLRYNYTNKICIYSTYQDIPLTIHNYNTLSVVISKLHK